MNVLAWFRSWKILLCRLLQWPPSCGVEGQQVDKWPQHLASWGSSFRSAWRWHKSGFKRVFRLIFTWPYLEKCEPETPFFLLLCFTEWCVSSLLLCIALRFGFFFFSPSFFWLTISKTNSHGECQLSTTLYLCFVQFIVKTLRVFFFNFHQKSLKFI